MKRSCWTRLPTPSVLCVKCSSKMEYKKTGWQSAGVSAMWIRVKYVGVLPAVPTQGPLSRLPAAWLHACLLPGYALRLKFPKITNNDKFNCKTAVLTIVLTKLLVRSPVWSSELTLRILACQASGLGLYLSLSSSAADMRDVQIAGLLHICLYSVHPYWWKKAGVSPDMMPSYTRHN